MVLLSHINQIIVIVLWHEATTTILFCVASVPIISLCVTCTGRGGGSRDTLLATCWSFGPNSSLQNSSLHNTLTINHSLSIELACAEPSHIFNKLYQPGGRWSIQSPTATEQHVSGDRGLHIQHLRVGAGFLHLADGLLEGVFTRWHSHHDCYLLVQSVEGLCHRFNRSLQLQRLSLLAGTGWSALFHVCWTLILPAFDSAHYFKFLMVSIDCVDLSFCLFPAEEHMVISDIFIFLVSRFSVLSLILSNLLEKFRLKLIASQL